MMGSHLVKAWSRTQDSVTPSSTEAELVALGKLAMEILGIRSMAAEWEMSDDAAASNLSVRTCVGCPEHRGNTRSRGNAAHQRQVVVAPRKGGPENTILL